MMDVTLEAARSIARGLLDACGDEREITDIYSTTNSARWIVEVAGEYYGVLDTTARKIKEA